MSVTPSQKAALKAMPVKLTHDGHLPPSAPHAGTIKALARLGLIQQTTTGWVLTWRGRMEAHS